jgi:hypothetical protein
MNGGADGGGDAAARGAALFHQAHGVFDDAANGAAPAGVGRADDFGVAVGEEDRRAIGGEDGNGEIWRGGDEGVGARALTLPWRVDENGGGGVNLMHAAEVIAIDAEGRGDAGAVFQHVGGVVV